MIDILINGFYFQFYKRLKKIIIKFYIITNFLLRSFKKYKKMAKYLRSIKQFKKQKKPIDSLCKMSKMSYQPRRQQHALDI